VVRAENPFLKHKETRQDHGVTIRALPDPETVDRQISPPRAAVADPLRNTTRLVWCHKPGECDFPQRVFEGTNHGYHGRQIGLLRRNRLGQWHGKTLSQDTVTLDKHYAKLKNHLSKDSTMSEV